MSEYFGGRGGRGLKFRWCKILEGRSCVNQGQNSDMGEGGIKNGQKKSNVFYGRPLSMKCLASQEGHLEEELTFINDACLAEVSSQQ